MGREGEKIKKKVVVDVNGRASEERNVRTGREIENIERSHKIEHSWSFLKLHTEAS